MLGPASPTSTRSSSSDLSFSPEPDLSPIYPTALLVSHSLTRACVYGELSVLQFLLVQPEAQMHVDLSVRDEDGVGLVSLAIHGFGSESERDVEREECVRLLIFQGADLNADNAGWTPLHHAALLSPPTLVSYLMTHGCSPFATTRRGLTPLDIVTAHSVIPGRADVALLLEEAMRGEGWTGGRMEATRRQLEERVKRKGVRDNIREDVGKQLGIEPSWWKRREEDYGYDSLDDEDEDEDGYDDDTEEEEEDHVYTPPADYTSMLVFSPTSLPHIYESLITNYPPSFRDCQPANLLYMLARFACLTCDHTWLEDFMLGATECIEDVFFNRPDDITCLIFWLRNCTIWLHLMQCDDSIAEACEMLGSFELIEETINSVFVFIIRLAERKIDSLLDAALLDYSQFVDDSIQFESDWSFFRPFKKKAPPTPSAQSTLRGSPLPPTPSSPVPNRFPPQSPGLGPNYRPPSPSPSIQSFSSSIRQSLSTSRNRSGSVALQSLFNDPSAEPEKETDLSKLTNFLTALQTLLVLMNINPALITQLWSQVMYWTACEIFNRVLTRKKYLCRSRAVQIGINLSVLEEWVIQMGLPRGVQSHLTPVRELIHWLQCLSSITEFPNLVAMIQTMKNVNPLQMRRAVRDYKYEVNEGRMTEECIQYLTQLQKDWERQRVKLGVEALRKEQMTIGVGEQERGRSVSPNDTHSIDNSASNSSITSTNSSEAISAQESIDLLFDRHRDKSDWEPVSPPKVLGELLDSRYMLPLVFPTNPRMLGALPGGNGSIFGEMGPGEKRFGAVIGTPPTPSSMSRSASRASNASHEAMRWRSRDRKIRKVGASSLKWVDGVSWVRRVGVNYQSQGDDEAGDEVPSEEGDQTVRLRVDTLTHKPSGRGKGRPSQGETTPVLERGERIVNH
ncbi:hypothetical protein E1B28_001022 [Marasmius oreades]|uniref:Dilute domain-containing protein n=1 Tax=Marasmius oreades TaxID=181124 RepID=A0A9P7V2M7_9AGAR|nr:uncharacterized protein E1B28_001022 [Marasmius oreades]KAG7099151.1 hypothetical protein E1B28_001022 [Marasmius oreades]